MNNAQLEIEVLGSSFGAFRKRSSEFIKYLSYRGDDAVRSADAPANILDRTMTLMFVSL